jgi:hypothetical protein
MERSICQSRAALLREIERESWEIERESWGSSIPSRAHPQ